jgi:hypothetical protein
MEVLAKVDGDEVPRTEGLLNALVETDCDRQAEGQLVDEAQALNDVHRVDIADEETASLFEVLRDMVTEGVVEREKTGLEEEDLDTLGHAEVVGVKAIVLVPVRKTESVTTMLEGVA